MNIVVGKFGRSILFDSSRWAVVGGDNEPSVLYKTLAEHNPEHTFYMIGRSDLKRYKGDDVPTNLVDVWSDFDKAVHDEMSWPLKKLAGVHVDGGIMMSGPAKGTSQPGMKKVYSSGEARPLQMMTHYVGPLVKYLNDTNVPYFVVSPDIYCIKMGRDALNAPKFSLSQYDAVESYKRVRSLEDQSHFRSHIPVRYAGIEKIYLVGREKPTLCDDKTVKVGIVCNEGANNGAKPRGKFVSWYVLSQFDDAVVYGKWSDSWMHDDRFVGPTPFVKLQEEVLPRIKYTVVFSVKRGWITMKFWEMAQHGIVPFLHPGYDTNYYIDCPKFLRLTSPNDFRKKVEMLEADEKMYSELREEINDMFLPEYYDGSYVNSKVMGAFEQMITDERGVTE